MDPSTTPILKDYVRDTLSPRSPGGSGRASPRASGEISRNSLELRRSLEVSQDSLPRAGSLVRRSTDLNRPTQRFGASQPNSPERPFSSDSIVQSFGESSDAIRLSSDDEGGASASNILDRSDVFQSPTIKKPKMLLRSSSTKEKRTTPSGKLAICYKKACKSTAGSDSEPDPSPSPRLQDIARGRTFPLQRASGWADWMKKRSKKMSSLLATESMGYLEKVSDMWVGGRRQYTEPLGMMPNEVVEDADDGGTVQDSEERFRARFALPPQEKLVAVYFGYLHRVLPLYGKLYLSNRSFFFRSVLPGTKTKVG